MQEIIHIENSAEKNWTPSETDAPERIIEPIAEGSCSGEGHRAPVPKGKSDVPLEESEEDLLLRAFRLATIEECGPKGQLLYRMIQGNNEIAGQLFTPPGTAAQADLAVAGCFDPSKDYSTWDNHAVLGYRPGLSTIFPNLLEQIEEGAGFILHQSLEPPEGPVMSLD
ncbi:hypothetical protein BU23DRAFT_635793 [Bimuria novae-zelandiae CBS 107.79]|uniref:Uncharacterized protein n=1 Tax=Bimuria novae-zelandiae CBS 107.79 TaxID=1447943 RepID=A0A6A5VBP2_9PLEO|nr:hypothetical protein BU23DRAFT_635793 [Bimuria novae-zelandiae CBS 107.79]